MTLVEEFRTAVGDVGALIEDRAELLPMVLARACVSVLPVAGAGLSVIDVVRVPLGSSDEVAARAERLQTTVGEGPCLAAAAAGVPLVADFPDLTLRWPVFSARLVEQTPFRSVVSLPLLDHGPVGALDLYLTSSPSRLPPVDVMTADIAEPIANALFGSPPMTELQGVSLPVWMSGESAVNRMNVWIAVGMLIARSGLVSTNALATLRRYAFSHDTTLDDLSFAIINHDVEPRSVVGEIDAG